MAVVGYRYLFGLHMGVSRGPVDELVEVRVGDRPAWRGSVTGNANVTIDAYNLFGGDAGEGGVQGQLDVMMGGPTQTCAAASPALHTMLGGGAVPGWRRAFTVFFNGIVTGMNPYPKPWKFRFRRALQGWDGEVWQPSLAVIPLTRELAPSEIPQPVGGARETTVLQAGVGGAPDVNNDITISLASTLPAASTILGLENLQIEIATGGEQPNFSVTPFNGVTGWEIVGTNLIIREATWYTGAPYSYYASYRVTNDVTTLPDAGPFIGTIKAMNPAHIIYECLTNREWGRGRPRAQLNDLSFTVAAQTLFNEGFGLCMRWVRRDSIESFVQQVLDHIGGVLYTDRRTAQLTLKLIRNDYTFANLPVFDTSSGILEIRADDVAANSTVINEIQITYRDPISDKERIVKVRNLASMQASGGLFNSVKRTYIGLPTADLATRVAQRDLKATGISLRRFTLVCDRRAYNVSPGSVIRIRDAVRSIPDMAVRVGRVEDGTHLDGKITLTVMQDVFSTPSTSFMGTEPPRWVPPSNLPCVGRHAVFEMPYFALARTMAAPDFALVDETSAYFGVALEQGSPRNASYILAIRESAPSLDDTPEGEGYYCGYEAP
jgi:Putative phage tail protein